MGESPIMVETANHEARTKSELVTVSFEAGRQREIWNHREMAQKSLRETAGLNMCEPRCSVVMKSHSNVVSVCAEPLSVWRRHYLSSVIFAVWMIGHTGVAGQACCEGCSREDGRSDECVAAAVLASVCVSASINETHEVTRKAPSEVGADNSTGEFSVMEKEESVCALPDCHAGNSAFPTALWATRGNRDIPCVLMYNRRQIGPCQRSNSIMHGAKYHPVSVSVVREIRPLRSTRGFRVT